MNEGEILEMISKAQEFELLKVRDDEIAELDEAIHEYCELPVLGGAENVNGKVNIQTFIYCIVTQNKFEELALTPEMKMILCESGADMKYKTCKTYKALSIVVLHARPAASSEFPSTLPTHRGHTELAMLLPKREAIIEKVHDSISFIQVC